MAIASFDDGMEAFMDTPLMQWQHRDTLGRLRMMHQLFSHLVRDVAHLHLVHQIDHFAAVAAWQPNTAHINYVPVEPRDQAVEDAFTSNERWIMHGVPFYYHLNAVATAPDKQNMGYAAALLQPMLDLADQQQIPLYLENTGGDSTTRFYERRGFKTMREHTFDTEGRTRVKFMRRDPRPAAVSVTLSL